MKKKILIIVLLIVGLLLLFSDRINDFYLKNQSKNAVKQVMNEISAEEMAKNLGPVSSTPVSTSTNPAVSTNTNDNANVPPKTQEQKDEENLFDFSKVEALSVEASFSAPVKFDRKYIIGVLRVPSVDLEIAIVKGVLNNNLKLGAGTMKPNQVMGKGNYTLAGHFNRGDNVLFNRVPKIKENSFMYITDKKTIYKYKVFNIVTVPETQVDMINDDIANQKGAGVLSLMTCYLTGHSGKRTFVQGVLVDTFDYTVQGFYNLDK